MNARLRPTLAALAVALALNSAPLLAQPKADIPVFKTADIGHGIRLHYAEQGRGTPVIFVHGSLADYGYWEDQIGPFARHFHAIAYSRRYNFPNTNPAQAGYSAVVDADDLAAFIKKLGLGRVDIVGHSYGALTALFLAHRHPELLRKVVLAEPPAVSLLGHLEGDQAASGRAMLTDIQRRMVGPMQSDFRAGHREAGVATFIDYVFNDPSGWEKMSPSSKEATLRDAHEWDIMLTSGVLFPEISPQAIREIKVPVLIMTGGKTYPFLRAIDRELALLLPDSRSIFLPKDGHQMWYQEPEVCRHAVEAFLSQP